MIGQRALALPSVETGVIVQGELVLSEFAGDADEYEETIHL